MRKLQLTYSPKVKEADLLGLVLGHDMFQALYYVVAVFELEDRTVANLMPLPPNETRIVQIGTQHWVTF